MGSSGDASLAELKKMIADLAREISSFRTGQAHLHDAIDLSFSLATPSPKQVEDKEGSPVPPPPPPPPASPASRTGDTGTSTASPSPSSATTTKAAATAAQPPVGVTSSLDKGLNIRGTSTSGIFGTIRGIVGSVCST
jgi:hypothetical protein